jgi:hypothetical protein
MLKYLLEKKLNFIFQKNLNLSSIELERLFLFIEDYINKQNKA